MYIAPQRVIRTWMVVGAVLLLGGGTAWAEVTKEGAPGAAAALPTAAASGLREAFPGSTLKKVERHNEGDVQLFEVTIAVNKGQRVVSVSADGVIVKVKREVALTDLPDTLVKKIREKDKGATMAWTEVETRAEISRANSAERGFRKLASPVISWECETRIDADGRVWSVPRKDAGEVLAPGEEGLLEVPGYNPPCVVYLPSDYKPGVAWPMILHLHGQGDSATTSPWLWGTNGKGYILVGLSYPTVLEHDPARTSKMITYIETVRQLVDKKYGVDQKRVVLSGTSMGGWGVNTYGFAQAAKGRYRGYCIIAAGPLNRPGVILSIAKGLPVLVLNGALDGNLATARSGVPLLEKAGAMVTFTVLPDEGHMPDPKVIWPPLHEWLTKLDPSSTLGGPFLP